MRDLHGAVLRLGVEINATLQRGAAELEIKDRGTAAQQPVLVVDLGILPWGPTLMPRPLPWGARAVGAPPGSQPMKGCTGKRRGPG